jgi:iron complex outermembrane receptor protein
MLRFYQLNSVCLTGLLLVFTLPVLAATTSPESTDLFEMSIEDLMNVEVYSAAKYKQDISETPSSVTVITSEEIKRYRYRDLSDILNSVLGFYTTYDRNYGYIGVRGFGRPGDYNSRILLLIDGHRMNDAISNMGSMDLCFPLDVDLIDRVEVIRGPASALYGGNTLFGVISVFTKSGRDYKGGQIAGEIGSEDAKKGRITYGNLFKNGVDVLVSGTYYDANGDTLYYPEFDDPATNYGRVNNDDENLKNVSFKISYSDFTLEAAHAKREKGIPTAPWGSLFDHHGTRTWDETALVGLTYEHEYDDDLSVLGRLSYHYHECYGEYVYNSGGLTTSRDLEESSWIVGEFQVTKRLNDTHKIVAGADAQYNFQQDQKAWETVVFLDDQRDSKNWGVFIQDEIFLTDKLIVYAGVRRDEYDLMGSTINPRGAVIYKLTDATTLKLLAGRAFRSPSFYELYYNDGNITMKANPQLDPETIKTYEAVLESNFNKNLRGTASVFYYELNDLINQTTDPGDGLLVFENLSQVTASGFELAVEGKWASGLRGRLGYAYVATNDETTHSRLANSPENMVNFNLI